MSKQKMKQPGPPRPAAPSSNSARKRGRWPLLVAAVLVPATVVVAILASKPPAPLPSPAPKSNAVAPALSTAAQQVAATLIQTNTNALPVMEVNKAVMVTVDLDFGPKIPSIAEALRDIERRYQPDDGQGRTFAILDAYGEPTPQGKLHISMHVSSEKPGVGALVFRRTGEMLWQSRIVAETNVTQFTGKTLLIYLDDGMGKTVTVDGSKNPATILDATIKEAVVPVSVFWPDGAEREVTFMYSACGCPVKAMVRRVGDRTIRTKELPVMFPDDPPVMTVITRLMGW